MAKIAKNTWPTGHGPDDFKCLGPAATKDGEFAGTFLSDLGCFTQDGKDSNKYYHGAVVQSKKNSSWYAYFEFGRTGVTNPGIQFIEGPSQSAAQAAYEKQMHAKNDKRGEWVQHKVFGKILQAKPGKDCYLVRPQATSAPGYRTQKQLRRWLKQFTQYPVKVTLTEWLPDSFKTSMLAQWSTQGPACLLPAFQPLTLSMKQD